MAKQDYRAVLKDLKQRRDKLNAAIEVMEAIVSEGKEKPVTPAIAEASKFTQPITAPVTAPVTTSNGHGNITVVDACYNILKDMDKPMHAKDIAAEVLDRYGKHTTYNSIAASLPQSAGNRFVKLGENVFGLKEWAENACAGE